MKAPNKLQQDTLTGEKLGWLTNDLETYPERYHLALERAKIGILFTFAN